MDNSREIPSVVRDWFIDVNSLTPRAICPHFLDILEIFRLDMGQISVNLLKKAFTTWQQAFPPTSVAFYDFVARACVEIKVLNFWTRKWPTSLRFSFFHFFFWPFLFLLFLSFCCSDWPSTGLAFRESIIETGKFCHWVASCSGRKLCFKFFTQFLSIFVHILSSISPITLI